MLGMVLRGAICLCGEQDGFECCCILGRQIKFQIDR